MKTKQQTKQEKQNSSELQSRSEQLSGNTNPQSGQSKIINQNSKIPTRVLPYVNFQQREENRALTTEKVLALLRQWLPAAYDLAEIVGKWVWVTFPEQPAEQVRGQLSQFGFHWNNARKCWQHPCGQFATEGSGADPRQKYGSMMASAARTAADQVAA